jgi:hypothetical protein
MRRCLAAFVLVLAAVGYALPATAQNRLAFVVGNDAYQNIDMLKKAVNDARSMANGLQQLGFRVVLAENLTRRDFIARLNAFENSVQTGDIVFLFYSGHGVELDGANYLVPIDAPKVSPQQQSLLKDESVSTDNIIQRLKARGTRSQIIVLDACRENPFRQSGGRSVGGARGLAPTQTPGGVFVIYSAGVGETALDRLSDNDADPNSVFTRSFLPLLSDPSQSLVTVAKETRLRVKSLAATIGATQSPAYYDEIDGDVFLARADAGISSAPQQRIPAAPPAAPPTTLSKNIGQPDPSLPTSPMQAGYIFANSDRVRLTPDLLRGLSREQLRLARNEIYARRGRYFRDPQLTAHFSRFEWYRPYSWEVALNPVEQANINLIASMER